MSLKFVLYYGVKEDGSLEVIDLKGRGHLGEIKAQARKDCVSPSIARKYNVLVVASDYGIVSRKKVVVNKEQPNKDKKKKVDK